MNRVKKFCREAYDLVGAGILALSAATFYGAQKASAAVTFDVSTLPDPTDDIAQTLTDRYFPGWVLALTIGAVCLAISLIWWRIRKHAH